MIKTCLILIVWLSIHVIRIILNNAEVEKNEVELMWEESVSDNKNTKKNNY